MKDFVYIPDWPWFFYSKQKRKYMFSSLAYLYVKIDVHQQSMFELTLSGIIGSIIHFGCIPIVCTRGFHWTAIIEFFNYSGFVCDFDWNHFCIAKCGFGDSSDWNNRFIINHDSSFAIFAHFSVPERCYRKNHLTLITVFLTYELGISRWWRIIWLVTWSLWGLCTFGFSLLSFATSFNKLRPDSAPIHQEPSELYRLQCHIWLFRNHCRYTGKYNLPRKYIIITNFRLFMTEMISWIYFPEWLKWNDHV